jgi:uncharacterized protein YndB with AHSA1/START domain
MTVVAVQKQPESLRFTVVAEFAASPERVWQLWEDPRQLERWWGPPGWPATFTVHELRPGGRAEYHMTGPAGERPRASWQVVEVDPPRHLVLQDKFANPDGTPDESLPPTRMQVTIAPLGAGRTQMQVESRFSTREAMERLIALGMVEGLTQAIGQIDEILQEVGVR